MIKENQDFKNEILKNIPNKVYWTKEIDENMLESCEFSKEYGFKAGSVEVKDDKTGETVELDLYCEREKLNFNLTGNNNSDYDPKLESVSYKYCLVDKKGEMAGVMNIKNYYDDLSKTLIENYPENLLKKEFNLSKNLLKYGDDLNEKPKSFVHVNTIQQMKPLKWEAWFL